MGGCAAHFSKGPVLREEGRVKREEGRRKKEMRNTGLEQRKKEMRKLCQKEDNRTQHITLHTSHNTPLRRCTTGNMKSTELHEEYRAA